METARTLLPRAGGILFALASMGALMTYANETVASEPEGPEARKLSLATFALG